MLEACRRSDPGFPDGKQEVLTQFAYIGDVNTARGEKLRVVAARSVITGMLAPRGQAWLSFHDAEGRFIGEQPINVFSPPQGCEGSLVYFQGEQTNGEYRGNALDLSDGFAKRKYVRAPDHRGIGSRSVSRPANPLADTLLRSRTVKQYIASITSKWCYLSDGTVDGGVIVAVGEEFDDHFSRGLTAKVMNDGRVYILTTKTDGEEEWKPD